jgi:H/ACA ribonucleoprotein complex non-core subunit NAF1
VRLLRTDKRFKGSDASNRYDEEVGDEEKEWSDDEEEIAAKRKEKTARKHG